MSWIGRVHALALLLAQEALAGIGRRCHQPFGQPGERLVGQSQEARLLALYTAAGRLHMAAVQGDQVLAGQLAQPGIERQRPLAQVAVELAAGLHEHFLHHVGRIDARRQAAVEQIGNHLAQAQPMASEQPIAGAGVAFAGLLQQLLGVGLSGRHEKVLYDYSCKGAEKVTALGE
jgi:hypothetical protein